MLMQSELKKILNYCPLSGQFTWLLGRGGTGRPGSKAGWSEPGRYTRINIKGKLHYAHRLAFLYMTGVWPENDVDHINGKKSDNRWSNLREATRTENLLSTRKLEKTKLA